MIRESRRGSAAVPQEPMRASFSEARSHRGVQAGHRCPSLRVPSVDTLRLVLLADTVRRGPVLVLTKFPVWQEEKCVGRVANVEFKKQNE